MLREDIDGKCDRLYEDAIVDELRLDLSDLVD